MLDHLLESGAIDFETLNDDWKLPKMIVRALGEYITRVHTNYYENRNDKKEYKNITYYI